MHVKKKTNEKNTQTMLSSKNMFSLEEFEAILSYERARSNRENTNFSVILLSCHVFQHLSPFAFNRIIKGLSSILRGIDHIGWWSYDIIGILLPSTINEGTNVCSRKVEDYLAGQKIAVKPEIYTYPDNQLEKKNKVQFEEIVINEEDTFVSQKAYDTAQKKTKNENPTSLPTDKHYIIYNSMKPGIL